MKLKKATKGIICMIISIHMILSSLTAINVYAEAEAGTESLLLQIEELTDMLGNTGVDILTEDMAELKEKAQAAGSGEEYANLLNDACQLGIKLLDGQAEERTALEASQLFDIIYKIYLIGDEIRKTSEQYSDIGNVSVVADVDALKRECAGIYEFADSVTDDRVNYSKILAELAEEKVITAENTCSALDGEFGGVSYSMSTAGRFTVSGTAEAGGLISVKAEKDGERVYINTVSVNSDGVFALTFPLKGAGGVYDITIGTEDDEPLAFTIDKTVAEVTNITTLIQAQTLIEYAKKFVIATGFEELYAFIKKYETTENSCAEVDIVNGGTSQELKLFLAKYKDNTLIECDVEELELSAGEKRTVKLSVEVGDDALYKIFVWKDGFNLRPCKAVVREKEYTGKTDDVEKNEVLSGEWRNVIEPCVIDSKAVVFDVTAELSNTNPISYKVYGSVDEGEEYMLGAMTVAPGIKRMQGFEFKGITNGEHKFKVMVTDGEQTLLENERTLIVMNGYEKQFMDEFAEFGINWNGSKEPADDLYMSLFDFAGFTAVRKDTYWSYVEKSKGVFDWSFIEDWGDEMLSKDIAWNAILDFGNGSVYPMWQSYVGKELPKNADVRMAPHTQEGIRKYANYGIEVLKRFPQISNLEIWNEPNIGFWQSDYTKVSKAEDDMNYEYPDLLKATAATIRGRFKNKMIGGMSFAYQSSYDELGDYLDFGLYPYMSDLSYHVYATHLDIDDDNAYENRLDLMEQQVIDRGGWKPMYLTESGWHTGTASTTRDEADIAENLPKLYTICDQKGHKFFAFALNDRGTDPSEKEHNWGMLKYDAVPKKHYISVAERNRQLNGGIYVGELDLGNDRIRAFVYLKQGKPVVMAWWDEYILKKKHTLTLDGESFSVHDLNGNLVSENASSVTLTKNPVYLNGLSHKYIAMAARADVVYDRSLFAGRYKNMLPSDILSKADSAFLNAENALNNVNEENIKASVEEFTQVGLEIINKFKSGAITDLMASRASYELSKTVETLCTVYMSEYDGEALSKPLYTTADAQAKADRLYRDDNRIMQYSDSILSYAVNTEAKAEKLCGLSYAPEDTKGYIAGWGLLTKVYCQWFDSFSDSEKVLNYGLLAQVLPETRGGYVNSDIQIKINANNYSKLAFKGTLRLYDESGSEIAVSECFELAPDGHKYIELPFNVQKHNGAARRELKISFVDDDGNRLADERLSFEVKE